MKLPRWIVQSVPSLAVFAAAAGAPAQSLTLIQTPPGYGGATPRGISEHGDVVAGHYFSARFAFRWTPSTGLVNIPPAAGYTLDYAMGCSLDGSVVVGHTSLEDGITSRGMRWTQAGGSVAFGPVMSEQFMGIEGCDGSGQTVFGSLGVGSAYYGFYWTLSQPNPTYLPLPTGGTDSRVLAMADNPQRTCVGTTAFGDNTPHATLWEFNTATNLWDGTSPSKATCISEDGDMIYGFSTESGYTGQLGWVRTAPTTFVNVQYLGFFIGGRTQAPVYACTAAGTTFTGSVLFGTQYTPDFNNDIAYMISTSIGLRDLNVWLPTVGVTIPPGVTLRDVAAVSNDGTAICGKAATSTGPSAYVVRGIPCLNAPVMSNHTTTLSYCHGENIEMTASIAYPYVGMVYFQWYRDNQPLSEGISPGGGLYFGTQNPTLLIQGAMPGDSGAYTCVASNPCGSMTSEPQYLTVYGPPLAAAPAAPEVCPGGTVAISTETANVTAFQWEYDNGFSGYVPFTDGPLADFSAGIFATVSGATTDTLTLSNTFLGAPIAIRFSGGNPCQILAPIDMVLNYAAAPAITSQPVTTNYCHGQPAYFTVGATSSQPLTYQWQLYHTGLQSWINLNDGFYTGGVTGLSGAISGSLTPTLTFTLATVGTVAPNQPFRCTVSNGCGSTISQPANLHICIADFNCDGVIASQDFFDFLTAFFNFTPTADVNTDFVVNSQDYFDFLAAFFAGCP